MYVFGMNNPLRNERLFGKIGVWNLGVMNDASE
jgi:hypothetical protein